TSVDPGSPALAVDDERARRRGDVHLVGLHAGELDDDRDARRGGGVVRVDSGPEARARGRQTRGAPEVREELLDLALEPVDVASPWHVAFARRYTQGMARLKLLLRVVLAAFGGLLYLWFAGVLNAARAKRRRA